MIFVRQLTQDCKRIINDQNMNTRKSYMLFSWSILLKYVIIDKNSTVDFIFKNKTVLLTILIELLWLKFCLNMTKFRLFHQKLPEISFFSSLCINSPGKHNQKHLTQSLSTTKGASLNFTSIESSLEFKFWRPLLTLIYDNQKGIKYF